MSMDDILNDSPAPEVTPTPEPAPAAAPVAAAPTPEPAPAAAPEAPPEPIDEPTGMTPKEKAFYAKSKDEREKRQKLEQEYAVLKAQLEQATRPKQPEAQPEPAKDFWEDPEGALKAHQEQIKQQIEESRRMATTTRIDVAEMMVKREHPDYNEKLAIFHEIAQQNPNVVQEMLRAENPALYAYELGKNHLELKQAGDLPTLRAQIEKETRLKLEAEFKAKEEARAAELANIPQSLTGVRSTGVNRPVWSGPPPLDDILHWA